VYTASPEELTLMLYNGLVKFLMQAQMALMIKTLKGKQSIIRAQDIISEFRCTLDMKYDIAHQLDLLYDYMYRRLVDANIKKDGAIVEEVLGFAKELRDTWEQAMKLQNSKIQERLKWLNRRILMNGTRKVYPKTCRNI